MRPGKSKGKMWLVETNKRIMQIEYFKVESNILRSDAIQKNMYSLLTMHLCKMFKNKSKINSSIHKQLKNKPKKIKHYTYLCTYLCIILSYLKRLNP